VWVVRAGITIGHDSSLSKALGCLYVFAESNIDGGCQNVLALGALYRVLSVYFLYKQETNRIDIQTKIYRL
jgi:hypothetical protein